ncbi:hypothetical protein [Massilia sp. ST3]|uniref:hypothetical protein n=1 Tax=Massilia sp. ST3 TaxID=2824903 RepID=UPI001B816FF0|nr:hypothetical protein [Massilia sp. ST3]MBQ5945970.1 hypothetical protein [Massilia sp. ST3]
MRVQTVSSGADSGANEDVVAFHEAAGRLDLLVIDGGTSVAERDYIDPERGDVVWFAQGFADQLARYAHMGLPQHECVHRAAASLHEEFLERAGGAEVPLHAWPIGAMTWARIEDAGQGRRLRLYSLGDCTTLLCTPDAGVVDLDPFVNPQEAVLQAEIARLVAEGVTDAAQRRARLLPMLRARREAQNSGPSPSILCLKPAGPFAARTIDIALPPGSSLLVTTDGFYRLVSPYGLYTSEELALRCLGLGLGAVLDELRAYERASFGGAALAVKRADDASAILWQHH